MSNIAQTPGKRRFNLRYFRSPPITPSQVPGFGPWPGVLAGVPLLLLYPEGKLIGSPLDLDYLCFLSPIRKFENSMTDSMDQTSHRSLLLDGAGDRNSIGASSATLDSAGAAQERVGSDTFYTAQRLLDLLFIIILFVITLPIMILTAIAIKLEDRGNIFYFQERVGFLGKPFFILKFRSMREDAESNSEPIWSGNGDQRVTRIGRIIRRFRIDELPQFVNVLWGEMSLVGPRPERPHFVYKCERTIPLYLTRHSVKPGISGWAQVNFRYGASMDDARIKHSFDRYYIEHQSVWIYLRVLLITILVVLLPSSVGHR